ncbi:hypothetical protein CEUSTIGMA_g4703.t1 [Chlamydomonas eustigma]|uniref:Gamma carbonic anhydrase n=1 Tax=Chlamydomonas eustigma TaxID=1157962 RepID=A0A250X2F3_9CHLO|nr:hypothetical protein CEUSTIGMA_g4703.t1 [Chlamydomonas eustigma]|eukprot:GAX77257.1 hypothetical protein CEUSTIGMA_g4703.t1 [Chlamydomonas eustigma]
MLRRGVSLLFKPCSSSAALALQTRSVNFYDAPNGPAVKLENIEDEWYNRQRPNLSLLDKTPWTQPDTWIAPNAVVAGDVDIYDQVAVFYGAVLRADLNKIRIGGTSVVLDRAVIHTARAVPTGLNPATLIGDHVTIEPFSVLRACRIEPKVIIGARSVICEGAIVESEAILTPGSVVPPARRIPSGELWGGNPARFIRKLTDHERDRVISEAAQHYLNLAERLKEEELPNGTAWRDVEAYREKLVANKEYTWINFREQKYLMRLQNEAAAMDKLMGQ